MAGRMEMTEPPDIAVVAKVLAALAEAGWSIRRMSVLPADGGEVERVTLDLALPERLGGRDGQD